MDKRPAHNATSCFIASREENASVGHGACFVSGWKSNRLHTEELVHSFRFGAQGATGHGLDLQLPVMGRVFVPIGNRRLFDAQPAGGFALRAEELDNFLCSHVASIAATMTFVGPRP